MQGSQDRILITHVGSLPRNPSLRDLLVRRERGERIDEADLARQVRVAPIAQGELFAAIRAQVVESAGRVDRVYELAGDLDPVTDAGRAFAQERAARAASFTASLYLTAWRMSEQVRLPGWLLR